MSYFVYEFEDGTQVGEYVDDKKSRVTLVTKKSSVLTRKIGVPRSVKKAIGAIEKLL